MSNLTQEELQIIKDTIPVLKKDGENITKLFYKILFEKYPEVRPMFNMDKQASGAQPKALAMAVLNAAQNIENLENTKNFVHKIGITHTNLNVKAEHYPLVGECLLLAIKESLGVGEDVLKAWEKAYTKIANYYIEIEKEIYESKNK